jgi:AhpD family alkylhydroperoxidase
MAESQTEIKQSVLHNFRKYCELMPGIGRAYDEMPGEVYKGGALEARTKRLMALSIAVASGCRGCILFQADHALELGASVEEVLEACGVAISMGGTMAAAEATRVVQYLHEQGRID